MSSGEMIIRKQRVYMSGLGKSYIRDVELTSRSPHEGTVTINRRTWIAVLEILDSDQAIHA